MRANIQRCIEVWANWTELNGPLFLGTLCAIPAKGKEIISFEYDRDWLQSGEAQTLDLALSLYPGPQYASAGRENFGLFLNSSPDRWGRRLMQRREAQVAREEGREPRLLPESDYLLGVYDGHRMGGLRFRTIPDGRTSTTIRRWLPRRGHLCGSWNTPVSISNMTTQRRIRNILPGCAC